MSVSRNTTYQRVSLSSDICQNPLTVSKRDNKHPRTQSLDKMSTIVGKMCFTLFAALFSRYDTTHILGCLWLFRHSNCEAHHFIGSSIDWITSLVTMWSSSLFTFGSMGADDGYNVGYDIFQNGFDCLPTSTQLRDVSNTLLPMKLKSFLFRHILFFIPIYSTQIGLIVV